jgi:hypothetical protein
MTWRKMLVRLIDVAFVLVLAFTLLSLVIRGSQTPIERSPYDAYDPRLGSIKDVDTVIAVARRNAGGKGTLATLKAMEDLLRLRFFHDYSRYQFSDNWLLWLGNALVHPHLTAKVSAEEDILQHGFAACSQQGLVVQAALRKMSIPFGTVEWPSHFTAAAYVEGEWYVVDPWEPLDRDRSRLIKYEEWVSKVGRDKILGPRDEAFRRSLDFTPPILTKINQFPAPTMAWVHPLSRAFSRYLWILALLWFTVRYGYRRPVALKSTGLNAATRTAN